jgi:hypothetical protein
MKLFFFVFSLVCFVKSYADDFDTDRNEPLSIEHLINGPLFVSLGSHCEISSMLRVCNQRKAAFPLDWVISFDGENLIRLLQEDFKYFGYTDFLIPLPNETFVNTLYKLEFLHDGNNYETFLPKYYRRIQRFRNLCNYRGKVIFIRYAYVYSFKNDGRRFFPFSENSEMSDEFSLRLYQTLKNYFPNLDFTLVILNTHHRGDIETEAQLLPKLLKFRANPFVDSPLKAAYFNQFFNNLVQYAKTH